MSTQFSYATKHNYNERYVVQYHSHPCYEIVYYLKGNGVVTIEDTAYTFHPNMFTITVPNQIHKEDSANCVSVKFIGFTTDSIEPKPGLYVDPGEIILSTMNEIFDEVKNKRPQYQTMLNLLVKKIIIQIVRLTPDVYKSNTDFEYIENYIKMHANQNTTIQQLAKDLNYNYDYLRQLFLAKRKISAKKYFFAFKLQNVKNYLRDSSLTINQIADITGFSSASHLCASFKKEFGCTPKEFREQSQLYPVLKNT